MKKPVFLSAKVPDITRAKYKGTNVTAIREAVLALIAVVSRERKIVFAGNPAVSPIIEHAARSLDVIDNIAIYYSEWFKDAITPAAKKFPNLYWTPSGRDETHSLELMRLRMMQDYPFCAAVFIGGMGEAQDDSVLFRNLYPGAPLLPIASTGGAAKLIHKVGIYPLKYEKDLLEETRYRSLFRKLFKTIP